jgi:hypothetical protein
MIQEISPIPKPTQRRKRVRKPESEAVITSPYKKVLMEKETTRKSSHSKKQPQSTPKNTKKPSFSKKGRITKKRNQVESESRDEEWPCIYCCETYASSKPGCMGRVQAVQTVGTQRVHKWFKVFCVYQL